MIQATSYGLKQSVRMQFRKLAINQMEIILMVPIQDWEIGQFRQVAVFKKTT